MYLDYAAATPVAPEVMRVMHAHEKQYVGNASGVHREGVLARRVIEDARELLARVLRVTSREITFTSGGTESNNLAIEGVLRAQIESGRSWSDMEVITTPLEHPSVLALCEALKDRGVTVHYVPVSSEGLIDMEALTDCINKNTVLITFAYANSEIGVVQDVKQITKRIRLHKKEHDTELPYVHLDASQAPMWLPCQVDSLGVDLMTLDSGKCEGPKGAGVLVHRSRVPIHNITYGGSQESGLRAGTESTSRIVGAVRAFARAQESHVSRSERVSKVRDYAIERIEKEIEGATLNGDTQKRIANNINISIEGIDGEYAVVYLDQHGIAASTRSACEGGQGSGSHVVRALGNGGEDNTIRLTLTPETTKRDMDRAVRALKAHVSLMENHRT